MRARGSSQAIWRSEKRWGLSREGSISIGSSQMWFYPDGRVLNHEIVRAGLAWWFVRYAPGDEKLRRSEAEARGARRGLWINARPLPSWEWRGRAKKAQAAIAGADMAE
jgi:hypothetical protein